MSDDADTKVVEEALDVLRFAEETVRAERWFREYNGGWIKTHVPTGWKGMTARGVEAAKQNLGVRVVDERWVVPPRVAR